MCIAREHIEVECKHIFNITTHNGPHFLNSFACCLLYLSYGVLGACNGFRTGILLEPVAVDLFIDVSSVRPVYQVRSQTHTPHHYSNPKPEVIPHGIQWSNGPTDLSPAPSGPAMP